jgi:hypothetical protein
VRRLRGVREGGEGGEGRGHTLHPIPYILPYTYAGVGEGRGGGGGAHLLAMVQGSQEATSSSWVCICTVPIVL